eukprot:12923699-Prorocentrum_lima.AAC.1
MVVGSWRGLRLDGAGCAPGALGIQTWRSLLGPRMCSRSCWAPAAAACTACPTMAAVSPEATCSSSYGTPSSPGALP